MAKKDLFIHTIQQVEVDQSKNIPTALFYKSANDYLIGYEALSATDDVLEINQDFKVDLGRHDSTATRNLQKFPTACGESKSALVMTDDFMTRILHEVSKWLAMHQVEEAAHILIADGKPFALDVTCSAASTSAKAYIGFDFGPATARFRLWNRGA